MQRWTQYRTETIWVKEKGKRLKRSGKNTHNCTKKGLNDTNNHYDAVTHLEPGILECEVNWALGNITTNKASRGDGIPAELLQIVWATTSSYVWMWELDYKESWVLRNWCFWTVVLEKTLESPLDCKEIHQSILKEISVEYSLEGLMPKLKHQYLATWWKELTHLKRPWCWERLNVGGEADDRGWDGWMASLIWWTWVWVSSGSWWWTGKPDVLQPMGLHSWRWLRDWTELTNFKSYKMMLLKCCTQYAIKFGKFNSDHKTEKAQFSFESQRKAMPKSTQTTV